MEKKQFYMWKHDESWWCDYCIDKEDIDGVDTKRVYVFDADEYDAQLTEHEKKIQGDMNNMLEASKLAKE